MIDACTQSYRTTEGHGVGIRSNRVRPGGAIDFHAIEATGSRIDGNIVERLENKLWACTRSKRSSADARWVDDRCVIEGGPVDGQIVVDCRSTFAVNLNQFDAAGCRSVGEVGRWANHHKRTKGDQRIGSGCVVGSVRVLVDNQVARVVSSGIEDDVIESIESVWSLKYEPVRFEWSTNRG